MRNEIDARGRPCPEPVVLTKKAIEKYEEFIIIVNEQAPRENVTRFAYSMGCKVDIDQRGEDTFITITRPCGPIQDKPVTCSGDLAAEGPMIVTIDSTSMGRGNDELGYLLMKSFIHTLTEAEKKPDTIIFFNTGVMLAIEGSEVLGDLSILSQSGVRILVCGTCLGFFEVKDKLAEGMVSNMYDITDTMLKADKLVQI